MSGFQADVFLLFKYILAAGLFQFSNISSSPVDPARGGGKNVVAKEQDLDTKLAKLLAGALGAPAQLVAGQSLCIASVGWHLRGLDEGGWDLKHRLGLGEKELR